MNRRTLDPGFDPRIADWLEDDPDRAPDAVLETVLAAFPSIPQRRVTHVPWRFPRMTLAARLSAAAIAIAILAVGGVMILQPRGPSVGNPSNPSPATSSSSPSTPASATASANTSIGTAPATTLGDWQAITDSGFGPYFSANQRIQLSIDWQQGQQAWIQTLDGTLLLKSNVLTSPPGELDFAGTNGSDGIGCSVGDLGRYTWSRTADGLFLTLTAIADACPNRLAAMSRTWVHSLSAVTDGQTGVFSLGSAFGDAWVKMVLPKARYGLGGADGIARLTSMEGPERALSVIQNPLAIDAPCGATRQAKGVLSTTATFTAYLRTLPGFTVATTGVTVGGLPAVHVTMTPTSKGAGSCVDGTMSVVSGSAASADAALMLAVSQAHSMWVVPRGATLDLFVYEGAGVTPADEQSVVGSFQFLDALPTP